MTNGAQLPTSRGRARSGRLPPRRTCGERPALLTGPPHIPVNPTIGSFRTADGRFITLMMVQPARYFPDLGVSWLRIDGPETVLRQG